ncbi:MAG TPA: hypothetical protein VD701_02905 [Steroidobacteraceae bacterium]|nr:hypothetical protein [Steroidobacteraceae bacterium]
MSTIHSLRLTALAVGVMLALSGCGGTRVLKAPLAGEQATGATAAREGVTVSVQGLIYRDGPGSWARDAYWDEYQVRVDNAASVAIEIERVVLVDALDHEVMASSDRRSLARGTKQNLRRYRDAGIKVSPGAPPAGSVLAGSALLAGGAATLSSAASAGAMGMSGAGSFAAAGAGVALGGIALVGAGVHRAVQNDRVQDALTARAWTADTVAASGRIEGSVFFPLVPAPRSLVVYYRVADATTRAIEVPLPSLGSLHRGPATARQSTK